MSYMILDEAKIKEEVYNPEDSIDQSSLMLNYSQVLDNSKIISN